MGTSPTAVESGFEASSGPESEGSGAEPTGFGEPPRFDLMGAEFLCVRGLAMESAPDSAASGGDVGAESLDAVSTVPVFGSAECGSLEVCRNRSPSSKRTRPLTIPDTVPLSVLSMNPGCVIRRQSPRGALAGRLDAGRSVEFTVEASGSWGDCGTVGTFAPRTG